MSTIREVTIVCINGGRLGGKTEEMLHDMSAGCNQIPTKHPDWRAEATIITVYLAKPEYEMPFLLNPLKQTNALPILIYPSHRATGPL